MILASPDTPLRPVSPEAAELLARGQKTLDALAPLERLDPPAPEAVRGATAGLLRELRRMQARLGGGRVEVGLFGLPKAGKSTLLNALAGRQVSATDILPETAFPIYLLPAAEASGGSAGLDGGRARVYFRPELNRPPVELSADELGRISREKSVWNPREVAFAEVPSHAEVLGPGFCFIDTPGLEEFVADYGDIADQLLNEETDAAILVATPDQAMREIIRKFLELAARRCPRLWIAINVDITAAGLRPDGTREILGTAEFPRIRERFTAKYSALRGLDLMFREGTASLHLFSAAAAKSKRLSGAKLDDLATDPACREFVDLARSARAYVDDPARVAHAVKFWRARLADFGRDAADLIAKVADDQRTEATRLASELARLELRRAEALKLQAGLREVLDLSVSEASESLYALMVEALGPFFGTPLRQTVTGWFRATESLVRLQENVKAALRTELESVRLKVKTAASERATKLARLIPDLPDASVPEPIWLHPVYGDEPPAAVVAGLKRLPIWLGRIAGIIVLMIGGVACWLLVSLVGFLLPEIIRPLTATVVLAAVVAWLGTTFWTRAQLRTRGWSGWAKMLFLPGDAEHIRSLYESDLRAYCRAEADAAVGWLRGFADRLLERKIGDTTTELEATRVACQKQTARLAAFDTAVQELRARSAAS